MQHAIRTTCFAVLFLLRLAPHTLADVNPPSEAFIFNFNDENEAAKPAWISGVEWRGGEIKGSPKCWSVDEDAPERTGLILIHLNTVELPADLSLTLVYEDLDDSDFLIQLFDQNMKMLVPDIFSNIRDTSRETKSDTYIINFLHHARARTIGIQRVDGPVKIHGFSLMSVVCELPSVVDTDRENCLSQNLDSDRSANNQIQAAVDLLTGKKMDWQRKVLFLSQQENREALARTLLTATPLPEYVPENEVSGEVVISATCGGAIYNIREAMQRWHPELYIQQVGNNTPGAIDALQLGETRMIAISHPMTIREREEYFNRWNMAPIDFPFALDSLQVLVHRDNPLTHITLSELESIYAESPSDAAGPIDHWSQLGGKSGIPGAITVYGGQRDWGTSKAFSSLAMQGKKFNRRMIEAHVIDGVEAAVAEDRTGIGFAIRAPRTTGVRAVPVSISSGREAFLPNAANIYAGNYPLTKHYYITLGVQSVDALTPGERELLDFILSHQGQAELIKEGMLPLTLRQLLNARQLLKMD